MTLLLLQKICMIFDLIFTLILSCTTYLLIGTNEGVAAATAHVNTYFRSVTFLMRNVCIVLTDVQREKLTSSDLTRYVRDNHSRISHSNVHVIFLLWTTSMSVIAPTVTISFNLLVSFCLSICLLVCFHYNLFLSAVVSPASSSFHAPTQLFLFITYSFTSSYSPSIPSHYSSLCLSLFPPSFYHVLNYSKLLSFHLQYYKLFSSNLYCTVP